MCECSASRWSTRLLRTADPCCVCGMCITLASALQQHRGPAGSSTATWNKSGPTHRSPSSSQRGTLTSRRPPPAGAAGRTCALCFLSHGPRVRRGCAQPMGCDDGPRHGARPHLRSHSPRLPFGGRRGAELRRSWPQGSPAHAVDGGSARVYRAGHAPCIPRGGGQPRSQDPLGRLASRVGRGRGLPVEADGQGGAPQADAPRGSEAGS